MKVSTLPDRRPDPPVSTPRRLGLIRECLRRRFFPFWILMLLLVLSAPVEAQFYFVTNNGAITITGYTGPGGMVVIPSTTNGLLVTSIETNAFLRCTNMTGVTIPNSISNIGTYAFCVCTSLTSVTVPDSVINMGFGAFASCSSLTNAIIGNGVESIGESAFSHCGKLASVIIGSGVTMIGNSAFYSCGKLPSVTIPSNVLNIDALAFDSCSALTNVTICNGVTNIGGMAFAYCRSLPSITIPSSVTRISPLAFETCTSLTNITIPNSISNIEAWTFPECTSLTKVIIPGSVINIGDYAFSSCYALTSVYFKGNAPTLGGENVFSNPLISSDTNATIYYLPGTAGWRSSFGGRPTMLWNPTIQTTSASFGVQTNQFGFTITGTADIPILIEANTSLASAGWIPLQTSILTNGSIYFSDPQWTNYPARFYRLRSP